MLEGVGHAYPCAVTLSNISPSTVSASCVYPQISDWVYVLSLDNGAAERNEPQVGFGSPEELVDSVLAQWRATSPCSFNPGSQTQPWTPLFYGGFEFAGSTAFGGTGTCPPPASSARINWGFPVFRVRTPICPRSAEPLIQRSTLILNGLTNLCFSLTTDSPQERNAGPQCGVSFGNPINAATGNKYLVCARCLVDVTGRQVADGLHTGVQEARTVMAITP
jgi:hypothetical protein